MGFTGKRHRDRSTKGLDPEVFERKIAVLHRFQFGWKGKGFIEDAACSRSPLTIWAIWEGSLSEHVD